MITGLTPSTFQKLELNAGVFLKNFNYASVTDKTSLAAAIKAAIAGNSWLGATRGGGSFEAVPTIREIEADGKRSAFKGSTVIDDWSVKLKTNLLEMTPDNMVLALGAASKSTEGSKTTITLSTKYKDDDYVEHLCWVGDLSDGSFVIIEIDNGLSTSGINLTFSDKSEGVIPVEVLAHNDSVDDQDNVPCRIVFVS